MESSQKLFENAARQIIDEAIQLNRVYAKRARLVSQYESHVELNTFPSNLQFKIAPLQFPASATAEQKVELNQSEELLLMRFKNQILNARKLLLVEITNKLHMELQHFLSEAAVKAKIISIIPSLMNNHSVVNAITLDIQIRWSAYQAKSLVLKPTVSNHMIQDVELTPLSVTQVAADVSSLAKQLSSLRIEVQSLLKSSNKSARQHNFRQNTPSPRSSPNEKDPRNHRRGSGAGKDGRKDSNQTHREFAKSLSRRTPSRLKSDARENLDSGNRTQTPTNQRDRSNRNY